MKTILFYVVLFMHIMLSACVFTATQETSHVTSDPVIKDSDNGSGDNTSNQLSAVKQGEELMLLRNNVTAVISKVQNIYNSFQLLKEYMAGIIFNISCVEESLDLLGEYVVTSFVEENLQLIKKRGADLISNITTNIQEGLLSINSNLPAISFPTFIMLNSVVVDCGLA